jgi:transcriptional regulator with XRE-family HTH domain
MWGSQRDYKLVGATLAGVRQRAKLTQQELAKRLEKSQSFVSDYERGKRRIDVVEFLVIARMLGVEPAECLTALLCPRSSA